MAIDVLENAQMALVDYNFYVVRLSLVMLGQIPYYQLRNDIQTQTQTLTVCRNVNWNV